MAGNKGLGLLLAGGAALVLMGGKKKKRSKSSGSSSSPTSPAYEPAGSDVIPTTPPPTPKKDKKPDAAPYPINSSASDQVLSDYASNPSAFESEHNVYDGDAIADAIYMLAQPDCPKKLSRNNSRHRLCIGEWMRIRSRVDQIAANKQSSGSQGVTVIEPFPADSNNWLGMYAADPELFGENYGLGRYAGGDSVTEFIYRQAQPHCPETLDKNDPAHQLCIQEYLRIRDEVFRIIQESD